MFLVDKYYNDLNNISGYYPILDKIINSFDNQHNLNYDLSLNQIIKTLEYDIWRFSNFQHLIVYGPNGNGKEFIVNKILEKIFGKTGIELKEIEYIVSGYTNTKTKILVKQSKHHIIIEPNTNGFDKYLIQDIIQEYAKTELLTILKKRKLFKVIVINKIDNLSYYAQASLRRTLEKYSDICKFILISEQLSKIIEPLRSRCIMIRIPLPKKEQILETLLYISMKENINISNIKLKYILDNCNNKITQAIWLLEMHLYNINYNKNWEQVIINIVNYILIKNKTNKILLNIFIKIKELFYNLFITNIPTQLIMREIMLNLIKNIDDIKTKFDIINITSIFEKRLSQGTRHIIHFEAYVIRLIYLFNNNCNLDVLEI